MGESSTSVTATNPTIVRKTGSATKDATVNATREGDESDTVKSMKKATGKDF